VGCLRCGSAGFAYQTGVSGLGSDILDKKKKANSGNDDAR
jgi:hypothetical protein